MLDICPLYGVLFWSGSPLPAATDIATCGCTTSVSSTDEQQKIEVYAFWQSWCEPLVTTVRNKFCRWCGSKRPSTMSW